MSYWLIACYFCYDYDIVLVCLSWRLTPQK